MGNLLSSPGEANSANRRRLVPDVIVPIHPGLPPNPRPEIASPLHPTIYHEEWWLDAATQGRWSEVVVRSGDRTIGRLPYALQTTMGMRECVNPVMTPFIGPAIDVGIGKPSRRRDLRRTVTQELLEQLPPCSRFQQRLYGGITDTLPFSELGYESRAVFTYEIDPAPEAQLWAAMRDKTRNVVRRAEEQGDIVDLEPEAFTRLYVANLHRQGKSFNYMWRHDMNGLFQAAIERGRGRLIGSRDASGNIASAIFVPHDASASYLTLTTRAPGTSNGTVSRLIWEAIKDAAANGRVFDFGGVGTRGSVLFYSGFAGEVRPRFIVERATPMFHAADWSLRKLRSAATKLLAPTTRMLTPAA